MTEKKRFERVREITGHSSLSHSRACPIKPAIRVSMPPFNASIRYVEYSTRLHPNMLQRGSDLVTRHNSLATVERITYRGAECIVLVGTCVYSLR